MEAALGKRENSEALDVLFLGFSRPQIHCGLFQEKPRDVLLIRGVALEIDLLTDSQMNSFSLAPVFPSESDRLMALAAQGLREQ